MKTLTFVMRSGTVVEIDADEATVSRDPYNAQGFNLTYTGDADVLFLRTEMVDAVVLHDDEDET